MKNKILLIPLAFLLVISLVVIGCPAPATTTAPPTTSTPPSVQPITLTFTLADPPVAAFAPLHQEWAAELEQRSGGRYKVEFAWGGAMGPATEQYDLARTGVADIAFFLVLYEPADFPRSALTELPWSATDIRDGCKIYWELYKSGLLDEEYKDVKMLYGWSSLGERIFMAAGKGPLRGLSDLQGKKIRAGSPTGIDIVKALGATPVMMTLPETYQAVEKGTVDGGFLEWGTFPPFKLWEVLNYCIEPGFKYIGLVTVMNQNTWNNLPEDVQAIIDDMAQSEKYTLEAGDIMVAMTTASRQEVLNRGGEITQWPAEDWATIEENFAPIWTNRIAEAEANGLPAKEIVNMIYSLVKGLGIENPAIGYEPGE